MSDEFIPTRTAALAKLHDFLDHAGRAYTDRRNYDFGHGHHAHVSQLSPYLRHRLISEAEVLEAVLDRHSYSAAEKFIQEVFWRTYWKGWLEMRPAVWDHYQTSLNGAWNALQTQGGLRQEWEYACLGKTEIECFNSWAHELVSTGYLHNHARMWFASIWIFTLNLPWQLGADFFLRHLLDGDPASNTLGWRWVAGIQTPGKTYLARTSNISKFTDGRFHPKWQLASEAPPREAPPAPTTRILHWPQSPKPTARTGVLLHEEDLSPSFLQGDAPYAGCAILAPQTDFGPLTASDHVTSFKSGALCDAKTRLETALGNATTVTHAQDIVDWAKTNQLDQIITPYAPVGPVAKVFEAISNMPDCPPLHTLSRPYDRMTWPHATKGFFPFKKQLPKFIQELRAPLLI